MCSVADQPGLLDTNLFIHAHAQDSPSEECRQFLRRLEARGIRAQIEPIILHELSYALPHYIKQTFLIRCPADLPAAARVRGRLAIHSEKT